MPSTAKLAVAGGKLGWAGGRMVSRMGWVGEERAVKERAAKRSAKLGCKRPWLMWVPSSVPVASPGCLKHPREVPADSVCLDVFAPQRMFFVYLPHFPAFGRGQRGVICQGAEARAAAGADLCQRAISSRAQ